MARLAGGASSHARRSPSAASVPDAVLAGARSRTAARWCGAGLGIWKTRPRLTWTAKRSAPLLRGVRWSSPRTALGYALPPPQWPLGRESKSALCSLGAQ